MDAKVGENQGPVTSCYLQEAFDKAAALFNYQERIARSGRRNGTKVTGIGVGQAFHPAGFAGFDGLVRITTDGKLHLHSGVGNLGTYSHTGTSRIAAEVLKANWDNCIVERGDTRKGLPWNIGQFGSNTSFTMARTNYVAADRRREQAQRDRGDGLGRRAGRLRHRRRARVLEGRPDARASRTRRPRSAPSRSAASSTGTRTPTDINPMTAAAATSLAGTGLIGVAKDNLPITASPAAFVAGFAEIELDTETGAFEIIDYVAVADCGTVIHPMGLATQIKGGAVMGFGLATLERHIYDPQNGLPGAVGLHQAKPASYLDVAQTFTTDAVDLPDPQSPLGTKGIGEPVMGAGSSALLCAISDALGGHYFNRVPVTRDHIVNALAKRPQSHKPLQVNTA